MSLSVRHAIRLIGLPTILACAILRKPFPPFRSHGAITWTSSSQCLRRRTEPCDPISIGKGRLAFGQLCRAASADKGPSDCERVCPFASIGKDPAAVTRVPASVGKGLRVCGLHYPFASIDKGHLACGPHCRAASTGKDPSERLSSAQASDCSAS